MPLLQLHRQAVPVLLAGIAALLLTGCAERANQTRSFVLPRGDVERGQAAFMALGCRQCHSVAGLELPAYSSPMRFEIALGGAVHKVRSYGDLLNSVINPDHELAEQYLARGSEEKENGRSPMPDFTPLMSVRQLIDIVEFLHAQYSHTAPDYVGIAYGP